MRVLIGFLLIASAMAVEAPLVAERAEAVRPLVVGSHLPAATIRDAKGEPVSLAAVAGEGRVVVVVYRGGWCPLCTRHFAALGQSRDRLAQGGWRFIAVSPDNPQAIAAWHERHGADGITRYSDSDADAIRALGLAYRLDEATRAALRAHGLDVTAASGRDHHILPVPAVLLVVDGEIRFLHADADYRRRLPRALLHAALAMVEAP